MNVMFEEEVKEETIFGNAKFRRELTSSEEIF